MSTRTTLMINGKRLQHNSTAKPHDEFRAEMLRDSTAFYDEYMKNNSLVVLARNIRMLRDIHGLKQSELAELCDLSQPQVALLERTSIKEKARRNAPNLKTLDQVAKALRVTTDVLLRYHASTDDLRAVIKSIRS